MTTAEMKALPVGTKVRRVSNGWLYETLVPIHSHPNQQGAFFLRILKSGSTGRKEFFYGAEIELAEDQP